MRAIGAFLAGCCLMFVGATAPENSLQEVVIIHGSNGMKLCTLDEMAKSDVGGAALVAARIDSLFKDRLAVTGYAIEGTTLYVAATNTGLDKEGAVVLRSEVESDCPNNSIFQVRVAPAFAQREIDDRIKDLLTSWTRQRHNTIDAPVEVININEDGQRYDVQLRL